MAQVLPQTTPEQRVHLYEDVETLISVGFLSMSLSINGVALALRTLGPGDSFLLNARTKGDDSSKWKAWSIASSLWLIDGYNLLDESNATPHLVRTINALPDSSQDILFNLTLGLFNRLSKALEAVEVYCFENLSRYRWKTFGGHFPSLHSGIPGVDRLGTNNIQKIWTFFNEIEDSRMAELSQWEGFKLVASAQSPKGVKKIDDHDRTVREAETARRQALLDKFYYTSLGILTEEEDKLVQPSIIMGSKSADDLADEMYRWVSGVDDWHDKIVNEYKRTVTDRFEQEKQERAERMNQLRERQDEESDLPRNLVGYTPGQIENLLKGRPFGNLNVRRVSEGSQLTQESLYQRHLKGGGPDAGALQAVDGKLIVKEGNNLTQQVANRQVPFGVHQAPEK